MTLAILETCSEEIEASEEQHVRRLSSARRKKRSASVSEAPDADRFDVPAGFDQATVDAMKAAMREGSVDRVDLDMIAAAARNLDGALDDELPRTATGEPMEIDAVAAGLYARAQADAAASIPPQRRGPGEDEDQAWLSMPP